MSTRRGSFGPWIIGGRTLLAIAGMALTGASAAAAQPAAQELGFSLPREAVARQARQAPVGGWLRATQVELGGRTAALSLQRFEVFTRDARLLVHGIAIEATTIPVPDRAYFRGGVEGEEDSLAFLAVGRDGDVRGLVVSAGQTQVIGPEREDSPPSEPLVVRDAADAVGKLGSPTFRCAVDSATGSLSPGSFSPSADEPAESHTDSELAGPAVKAAALYSIVVSVETDYELFAEFGNVDAEAAYIGDLMGAISAIYYRDVNTTLRVNLVSLWTGGPASDPWTATDPTAALCEVGTWWHANRPMASYPRGTVHFIAGKGSTAGVAWVGALCTADFSNAASCAPGQWGGSYGVTMGVSGSFNPSSPTIVWDIHGVAHEIGHNFNTPHTHCYNALFGAGQEIDRCYSGESIIVSPPTPTQCYSGAICVPGPGTASCGTPGQGNGTIMSYCNNVPGAGGFASSSLTFGNTHPYGLNPGRVATRMQSYVAGLAPSCRRRRDAPPADFNGDGRSEVFVYRNGTWVEFPFWPGG